MTVKELIEKLDQFPENYTVVISVDEETRRCQNGFPYTSCIWVGVGVNELDTCVIIDDGSEEEYDDE